MRRIDESREDCLLCILASLLELDSPSDSNPPKEIVVDIEFALVLKSSSDDVEKRLSLLLASEQSEAAKSPDVHTSKAFRSDSPYHRMKRNFLVLSVRAIRNGERGNIFRQAHG